MAVTGILENIRGCYYVAEVLGYDPKADMVVKLKVSWKLFLSFVELCIIF